MEQQTFSWAAYGSEIIACKVMDKPVYTTIVSASDYAEKKRKEYHLKHPNAKKYKK